MLGIINLSLKRTQVLSTKIKSRYSVSKDSQCGTELKCWNSIGEVQIQIHHQPWNSLEDFGLMGFLA